MWNHSQPSLIASTTLLVLCLFGCGESDGLPREAISGSVSIEGKPVSSGSIAFYPTGPDSVTQGGSIIQNGTYSISREEGLVPGMYKVVISSTGGVKGREVDKVQTDSPGKVPIRPKETIPAAYNTRTILTAEVQSGGDNVFPFELLHQTEDQSQRAPRNQPRRR